MFVHRFVFACLKLIANENVYGFIGLREDAA